MAVFALFGITSAAYILSGTMIVFEFGDEDERPTYIGLTNTSLGLVNVVGPLLAVWLAGVGFGLLFAACAVISFVAWVSMRWWVEEPRRRARA